MFVGCDAEPNPPPDLPALQLNGDSIPRVSSYKHMGLMVSDDLSFARHIRKINSKLGRLLGRLSSAGVGRYIPPKKARLLVMSVVNPLLEYGSGVWSSEYANSQPVKTLLSLWRRLVRRILKVPQWVSFEAIVGELDLLEFHPQIRWRFHRLLMLHRICAMPPARVDRRCVLVWGDAQVLQSRKWRSNWLLRVTRDLKSLGL
jgi:hypothetical protein